MINNTPWVQRIMRKEMLWVGIVTLLFCLVSGPSFGLQGSGENTLTPNPYPLSPSFSFPLLYKLYWIGSISMVVLLIFYFLYLYKKEKYRFVKPLTFVLLFLALSLYLMEQGRIFTGHFDPVSHLFIPGYQEANEIGFLRFIYKLTLGIALCAYGFTNFLASQKNKKSINSEAELN